MQEARNLCSQRGRFQHVPHRACGIEELALELRWDRVPLHDDGRAEAAKNVLLGFGDAPADDGVSSAVILDVLRSDDLIEIVRQPVLVFGERSETCLRSLKFADFARIVSMFERFGRFCRLCAKLLCREHWSAPFPGARLADFRSTVLFFLVVDVGKRTYALPGRIATAIDADSTNWPVMGRPSRCRRPLFQAIGRPPLWLAQFIST